jgi:cysteine desulfurase/selenocysteine lyase
MVAACLKLPKDEKIVTTTLEHHSGSLPFVERARRDGLRIEIAEVKKDGTFDIEQWKEAIDRKTSIVSVVHSSNVTGTVAPLKEIVEIAHDNGALVMSDDAQYAPHHPLDVQKYDVDFSAISVHKMCGPSGMGVLYGKMEHLKSMDMFLVGGDTVADVRYENGRIIPEYLPPPEKFEAGLQNYAGAIGAGAAAQYLEGIGMKNIEKHERSLLEMAIKGLQELDHIKILGTDVAHDVAAFLSDEYSVMIRSGAHCVHPYHYQMGIPPSKGTNRASIYLYNNQQDIEIFLEGIQALIKATS